MVRSEARVIGVFTLNAYEAFERERLRLLAETNKFLENVMFGYTPEEWLKAIEKADKQEQIKWRRVNDSPFEYAIQQGLHGDEFVKLIDGTCLRRNIMEQKLMKCPKCSKELNVNNTCNETDCYIGCKKPMTREEAVKKVLNVKWNGIDGIINALEALGLLKFDEAPKKQVEWVNENGLSVWHTVGYNPGTGWTIVNQETVELPIDNYNYNIGSDTYTVKIESIVKALKAKGYRIYKGAYAKEL